MICNKALIRLSVALIALVMLSNVGLADGPDWMRRGYDLAQTHYYPYGSEHLINLEDYQLSWSNPITSRIVLTANVLESSEGIELITWDSQTLTVYTSGGAMLCTTTVSGHTGYTTPVLADVTGDGIAEIICWSVGNIWVYDGNCSLIASYPGFGSYTIGAWPICALDFDHDGAIEILVRDGSDMISFEVLTGFEDWRTNLSTYGGRFQPVADLDVDGTLEVISDSRSGWGAATTILNTSSGDILCDTNYGSNQTSHAIANVGNLEDLRVISFLERYNGSTEPLQVNVYDMDSCSVVSSWDGPVGRGIAGWAIANFDDDPENELLVCTYWNHSTSSDFQLFLIDDDMSTVISQDDTLLNTVDNIVNFCAADLTGNGVSEILVTDRVHSKLWVLNGELDVVWSYNAANIGDIALSDLNNDGIPEIILTGDSLIVLSACWGDEVVPASMISPDPTYVYWAFAMIPMVEKVYLGDFGCGYDANDIDPWSAILNGSVSPIDFEILPSMEGFTGEVIELHYPLADFIWTYPVLHDTTLQEYNVSGMFTDGHTFSASGEVTIIGKNSRSARGVYLKPDNDEIIIKPSDFALNQNQPNPFNPTTEISFSLPKASHVTIDVFNILGQKAAILINDYLQPGDHSVTWDAAGIASGVYFYRLTTDELSETKRMLLLK